MDNLFACLSHKYLVSPVVVESLSLANPPFIQFYLMPESKCQPQKENSKAQPYVNKESVRVKSKKSCEYVNLYSENSWN